MDEMKEMRRMIEAFLNRDWSFDKFEQSYYDYWLNHAESVPADSYDLFQQVHERLDWTSQSPSDLERKDGWWNRSEYESWLRDRFSSLRPSRG